MIFTDLRIFNIISTDSHFTFIIRGANRIDAQLIYYLIYFITAGICLFLIKPRYVNRSLFICIPLLIIGFILMNSFENTYLVLLSLLLMGVGAGALFVSFLLFFVTLNISERLLSTLAIVASSFCYFIITQLIGKFSLNGKEFIFPLVDLLLLFLSIFRVNREEFSKIEFRNEKIPVISMALVIFMLSLIMISSFLINFHLLNPDFAIVPQMTMFQYLGYGICLLFVLILFMFFKDSMWLLICTYLVVLVFAYQTGLLYLLFDKHLAYGYACSILSGLALSLGQVTLLMLIGKVFEDKSNLKAFRVTVFISIVTAGIIGAIVERIMANISIEITLTISLFTTGAFLLIGLMFYSITQKEKNDIKVGRRIVDASEEKPDWEQVLTPKEKEVFALLLEGLTMRQIAGELHMKYDAVNYHYKNIYRKLNINSRVELIVRYVKN